MCGLGYIKKKKCKFTAFTLFPMVHSFKRNLATLYLLLAFRRSAPFGNGASILGLRSSQRDHLLTFSEQAMSVEAQGRQWHWCWTGLLPWHCIVL